MNTRSKPLKTGHKTDAESVTNTSEDVLLQLNAISMFTRPLEINVYILIINTTSVITYAKILISPVLYEENTIEHIPH